MIPFSFTSGFPYSSRALRQSLLESVSYDLAYVPEPAPATAALLVEWQ